MSDLAKERYKNEIIEVNVNWHYGHVTGSAEPIATVDFKIMVHDLQKAKDYLMEGKRLVGNVEINQIEH